MQDQITPPERWLPVVGFEGFYEVSDQGQVRSLPRIVEHPGSAKRRRHLMHVRGRMLRQTPNKDGYLVVKLYRAGRKWTTPVHRLVLEAFVGFAPVGHEVAHWNRAPADNSLQNLRWATRLENHADQVRHGTRVLGERCGRSKLTRSDVVEIRALLAEGVQCATIARRFGVRQQSIWQIKAGRTWKHVQ